MNGENFKILFAFFKIINFRILLKDVIDSLVQAILQAFLAPPHTRKLVEYLLFEWDVKIVMDQEE